MKVWRVSINGGIIVCIAGATMTYVQQDYRIGVAGWILSMLAFVWLDVLSDSDKSS